MKQYEKLTIRDHFMFGKVCLDTHNSELILSALLNRSIKLNHSDVEHYMQEYASKKYVRLDLLAFDEDGSFYNAELQHKSNDESRQKELPFRSRYYQALIDTAIVNTGIDYASIPEIFVIFICTYDPFELGLPQYTIKSSCMEDEFFNFYDGIYKIFFNTTADLSSLPPATRNMLQYIENGKVNDEATKHINDVVREAIEKEIWKEDYMLTVVHDRDVYRDGYDSGYDTGYNSGFDSRQEEVDKLNAELSSMQKSSADKDDVIATKDAIIAQLTAQLDDIKKNNN